MFFSLPVPTGLGRKEPNKEVLADIVKCKWVTSIRRTHWILLQEDTTLKLPLVVFGCLFGFWVVGFVWFFLVFVVVIFVVVSFAVHLFFLMFIYF